MERLVLLARALDANRDAVVIFDARETEAPIIYVNEAFEELTGYTADESLGRSLRFLQGSRTSEEDARRVRDAVRDGRKLTLEFRNQRADGSWFWNKMSFSPIRNDDGDLTHYICTLRDVSRRVKAERQRDQRRVELEEMAHHDWLTGLPNRARYRDAVRDRIREYRDKGVGSAVMFLDLDDFKEINDSLGHHLGDEVLKHVAQRLQRVFPDQDIVARAGGDEFKILVRDVGGRDLDRMVSDALQDVFDPPFIIEDQRIHLDSSVGVVELSVLDDDEIETTGPPLRYLARAADRALYKAKEASGTAYHLHSPESESFSDFRIQRENRMREGLVNREFKPAYQPIYRTSRFDRTLAALEVLCRWEDPERGTVMPGEFIPLAEQSGLIGPLTEEMVHQTAESLEEWDRPSDHAQPLRVFVNLSPTQISNEPAVQRLADVADEACPEWAEIWFEVTESALLEHPDRLKWLRGQGHGIVIDDFGTGFSSLSRLRDLTVDALKIDMSFVHGILNNSVDRAIVKSICTLGRDLGIGVVGEGVEDEDQLRFLLKQGCRNLQGYFLARPSMALEDLQTAVSA